MTSPSNIIRLITLLAQLLAAPAFAVTPMVATGYGHTAVLKSDGTVAAWGDNAHGQRGIGNMEYRLPGGDCGVHWHVVDIGTRALIGATN